ncbi:hypothetical protein VitviT2T_021940 [Vitis vinifera]|uniref:Reverse transcriptase Ty1/copia-type domain-containing protein n=1 Tax=Vitis vinifera TaxID=29760 RepID=A0ABY9DB96_VITVI|nr:hypothetical protein VitviT2T_021940 [Vitis vinifera]
MNASMLQPNDFIVKGQKHLVCKLHKSIYRLKQASCSWKKCFDHTFKTYEFNQNKDKPCVHKKAQVNKMVFMILPIDDILLIQNDVRLFSSVKI